MTGLLARLRRLEHDPNLRHTAARWNAHEAVYPGLGGLSVAATYDDSTLRCTVDAALTEFQRVCDKDDPAVEYMQWVHDELAYTTGLLPTPPAEMTVAV